MPICYVIISENAVLKSRGCECIRNVIATALNSKARRIDASHVVLRCLHGQRDNMLADVEIEIYAQMYWRRILNRDKRASYIAQNVSICLNCSCATWINLGFVGYSRHETNGSDFFSDSENVFVYWWQRLRGIATRDHSIVKQQGE